MQRTLIRTAYNTIIYEILDFGISVFDRDLNLIADSPVSRCSSARTTTASRRPSNTSARRTWTPGTCSS